MSPYKCHPELRELGPVGGVIRAMMERAADDQAQAVQSAAEELEVYCDSAGAAPTGKERQQS